MVLEMSLYYVSYQNQRKFCDKIIPNFLALCLDLFFLINFAHSRKTTGTIDSTECDLEKVQRAIYKMHEKGRVYV